CAELGAKLVVTLGGGYGRLAWRASANYLRFLLTGYWNAKPEYSGETRRHYERIARELVPAELQSEPGALQFTEEDIM
ncbi:MAG: hypothetical protein AAFY60_06355, partial [Myxococcota bacterium]